ncbi:spore germination protein YaaH [Oceanobacillus picturae]|uniref:Spore germination protein YaaH n=1 Tax=Oceanobacillus picturae TaxID=171693 RepID=A0A0U9H8F0_9BACI|nr:glycoside hydrolase family 18 protein [Oceanobacillus picturae]GAQ18057.1 spore germination protein YaaH [Oceanobacillus picturae]
MQIHVVEQGQTLYEIANTYSTSVTAISQANELDAPDSLVVGQALVIPIIGRFYFVQQGDSLYSIAQQFNMSPEELARINQFPIGNILPVGYRLYIPQQPRRSIQSAAYIEPMGDTVSQTLINAATRNSPYLTYLSIFSYNVNRDGTLTPPPVNGLAAIAEENNTALMLVLTNLEEGSFSAELGHIILTVQAVQNTLLDSVLNVAEEGGYTDIHFDFEFLRADDREAYNAFLRKAKERFSQAGLMLSTALAPKTSGTQSGQWYEAHDYAAHGEIADFVVLMTYEWGYSYGPPLAVSPLNEVRRVVEYALTEMPSEKIMLGQNLYGYDWTLPYEEGGEAARAVSPQQAITIARENNAEIQFDPGSQAPFFIYTDGEGNQHEVWFEDARSIQAKFNLIKELNLRGIAYWKLGLAFPQNWLLLNDQFEVEKLV